jgi:hypothetical protein
VSKKRLRRHPRKVKILNRVNSRWEPTQHAWWYEEKDGIRIVVDNSHRGYAADQYHIPWQAIRSYMMRRQQQEDSQ